MKPDGLNNSGLDSLFLHAEQSDDISPFQDGEERELYAKLQFTPSRIDRERARFSREYQTSIFVKSFSSLTEGIVLQPDGMITLLLTRIIKDDA